MRRFPGVNSAKPNCAGLTAWVKEQHAGQMIRKTEEPYFDHLLFVAEKAGAIIPLGYDIGLCHDLIEKTSVTASMLKEVLISLDYPAISADHITKCVVELTDVFTKTNFPQLKKKARKKFEAKRLATISPNAQTVKYADLIYNINWMLKHARKKVLKYLGVKKALLETMHEGGEGLHNEVLLLIDQARGDKKTLNAKRVKFSKHGKQFQS